MEELFKLNWDVGTGIKSYKPNLDKLALEPEEKWNAEITFQKKQ